VSISSSRAKEQISQNNENKRFLIFSITDKGVNKEQNQDGLLIKYGETALGHCALLAVADGVGGLSNGEQASRAVIDKLRDWWDVTLKAIAYRSAGNAAYLINESLSAAINGINYDLYELSKAKGLEMGTTLSLIFIMDNWYCIKHVGDSRVYIFSSSLQQLTEDDNLLARCLKRGEDWGAGEDFRGYSNIITNCIGLKQSTDIFEQSGKVSEKNGFMLCTDGFYKRISHNELNAWLQKCGRDGRRTQELLQQITHKARKRGELDDISAIIVNPNKGSKDLWNKLTTIVKGC